MNSYSGRQQSKRKRLSGPAIQKKLVSLTHGARLVTPLLEDLARLAVWDMPSHETSKVSSDFMMDVLFLDIGHVKRVSGGEKVVCLSDATL